MMRTNTEQSRGQRPELGIGSVQIRVVVMEARDGSRRRAPGPEDDGTDDEPHLESGRKPIDSYLERPARGKQCVVFLVNGQRHHGFDNAFTTHELGFKYLRNRLIVIVDLDGLAPEAIAELMQGSRQGFYEGATLQAVRKRLVLTLKNDPDLQRLEDEAEQEIAELSAGDSVVREKLDKLIEDHHGAAEQVSRGLEGAGELPGDASSPFGRKRQRDHVVVAGPLDMGTAAESPVIVVTPESPILRLRPDQQRSLRIDAFPPEDWGRIRQLELRTTPKLPELNLARQMRDDHAGVEIVFVEPEGFDEDQYPLETTLQVYASFEGHEEPRFAERQITVSKPGPVRPRPTPVLRPDPTFLKVASRQPVRLRPGGPSTHVKLRWDGQDTLAVGSPPLWRFRARCLTLANFPFIGFSRPVSGRFELLLDSPPGLKPGVELEFEILAQGPGGKLLSASLKGSVPELREDPDARRVRTRAPERLNIRRPPYDLKYIRREQWATAACWGDASWSESDAGCFLEPTDARPLTLLINQDLGLLDEFRGDMRAKKTAESRTQERLTRYTSHIAYHLYQMHQMQEKRHQEAATRENGGEPREGELRDEVNRVARTLLSLMRISR